MHSTVLTIAGSDCSGGAGIQADLKAIAANGGYGASVLTAITAQNTRGVTRVQALAVDIVEAQLEAVFSDLSVVAVKTGMLATEEIIRAVARELARRRAAHVVCDPVMISKTGHRLLPDACVEALARDLLPLCTLVTPNAHEASALSGIPVHTPAQAEQAGRRILARGAQAVLVKGGHFREHPATDVLVTPEGVRTFPGEWIDSRHTHGTGCTYSAAIATQLSRGSALAEAIGNAKVFLTAAIRHGVEVGKGVGPTDPFFFLRKTEEGDAWLGGLRGASGSDR